MKIVKELKIDRNRSDEYIGYQATCHRYKGTGCDSQFQFETSRDFQLDPILWDKITYICPVCGKVNTTDIHLLIMPQSSIWIGD